MHTSITFLKMYIFTKCLHIKNKKDRKVQTGSKLTIPTSETEDKMNNENRTYFIFLIGFDANFLVRTVGRGFVLFFFPPFICCVDLKPETCD